MRARTRQESAALLEQTRGDAETHRHEVEQSLITRSAQLEQAAARRGRAAGTRAADRRPARGHPRRNRTTARRGHPRGRPATSGVPGHGRGDQAPGGDGRDEGPRPGRAPASPGHAPATATAAGGAQGAMIGSRSPSYWRMVAAKRLATLLMVDRSGRACWRRRCACVVPGLSTRDAPLPPQHRRPNRRPISQPPDRRAVRHATALRGRPRPTLYPATQRHGYHLVLGGLTAGRDHRHPRPTHTTPHRSPAVDPFARPRLGFPI